METKIKITFWLYKAKSRNSKLSPIYLRVRYDYDYFTKSTGLTVKESLWDKKSMRVKGGGEAEITNSQLDTLQHKIVNMINQLTISGRPFDVEVIKNKLDGKEEKDLTLFKVYNDHLRMMRKLEGKDYAKATIVKYTNTKVRLSQYVKNRFKRTDIFLHELNHDFMQGFEIFLKTKFDNSKATCYKHYQRFTRIINIALQRGYINRHPFPTYKIKMPKKKIEYLTQEEVDRIANTNFEVERLNIIKDLFIFCCYSGLAYAEVSNLTEKNITIGMDGEKWMNILRKKTNKHYQVPLLPQAIEILNRYKNHPISLNKGILLPVPSNVKYNAYLKEIGRIAKVNKNLTTHLSRKTFATTIMLANGVNIGILSKILGHASVQVTLDSYGAFNDQLMLQNMAMLREKLARTVVGNRQVTSTSQQEIFKRFPKINYN